MGHWSSPLCIGGPRWSHQGWWKGLICLFLSHWRNAWNLFWEGEVKWDSSTWWRSPIIFPASWRQSQGNGRNTGSCLFLNQTIVLSNFFLLALTCSGSSGFQARNFLCPTWRCWGLNLRPFPWETCALPLSHSSPLSLCDIWQNLSLERGAHMGRTG